MTTAQRGFFLHFLLASALVLLMTALYQRMINPSLTQVLDIPSVAERGNMPPETQTPGQGRTPLPLPEADGSELGALMARFKQMPTNLDVILDIAALFTRNKDWPNALGFLKRAAELAPADMRPAYFLGVALAEKGDYADAAVAFEKALLLSPGNAAAGFNLAILYRHYLNQPDKAGELLQSVVAAPDADEAVKARARQELTDLAKKR